MLAMSPKPSRTPHAPIEQHEIEEAVLRSGYPLEIRLLEAFESAGMAPQIGTLVRPEQRRAPKDHLATREIDIVAHLTHRLALGARTKKGQDAIHTTLSVLVAAKNLAASAAIVGFKWRDVPKRDLLLARCRFGGSPTTVLDGYPEANTLAYGEGGLADAFEPLAGAPVCVQWSIARRGESLDQEKRYWQDLDVLVKTEWSNAVATSHGLLDGRGVAKVLLFQLPVLVVATNAFHIYDALAKQKPFTEVDWFTLRRQFDLGDRAEERLIDVVTEAGLPRFIEACKKTMAGIAQRIDTRSEEVAGLATAQHAKYEHASREALLDAAAAATRGGY